MPLDMAVIEAGALHARTQRIEQDHKEFRQISDSWANALREAFAAHASDNPPASQHDIEADASARFSKMIDALPNP